MLRAKTTLERVRQLFGPPIKSAYISSYEDYVKTQKEGFKAKIDTVFVQQVNIAAIASYSLSRGPVASVLCHGTRNGAEQRFFRSALPDAAVLGTEIGDGASQFPDTIEWDFHNTKPEWIGAWDLIYSNSWDHAAEPDRAIKAWASCLSRNGILILEHTNLHTVRQVRDLDPFGASFSRLIKFANDRLKPAYKVIHKIDPLPVRDNDQRAIVIAHDQSKWSSEGP